MDNAATLSSLNSLFKDVSGKLTNELALEYPNTSILTEYRKQLSQLDKHIRRILIRKEMLST